MANIYNRDPIIITSAMSSSYKSLVATTLGTLFTLRVEKIDWKNPASTNDTLHIIDPGGDDLLTAIAPSAGGDYFVDWTANPKLWQDFRVSQIDSGTLYIYTRAG